MADVNRGNRPLSPHLTVYRPYLSMMMSITHRITGVALTLGLGLIICWFLAAAIGPEVFALADAALTSIIGLIVLVGSLWALWYHFANGLRHLWWDTGHGFDLRQVHITGLIALAVSVLLTALTVGFALL
ncbi:MAG: succinate dehydrogenase, cytochrome b556 subunit [Pseudomonadota bacterium]